MEYTTAAPDGAALLDERMPGWADRIDLEVFVIGSTEHCILAQLGDGDYWTGKDRLFEDDDYGDYDASEGETGYPPYRYGFDVPAYGTWSGLQEEWEALVRERKTA